MKLYEIDLSLYKLLTDGFNENCVDYETGEIDEAKAQEYLNTLPIERTAKLEGYGCVIKNLTDDIAGLKTEIDKLTERKKAKEKQIERLKNAVTYSMQLFGDKKFETPKVEFSFRKSETVVCDNIDELPEEFIVKKVELNADKKAIKQAIKQGTEVKGASLIEKYNLQVK